MLFEKTLQFLVVPNVAQTQTSRPNANRADDFRPERPKQVAFRWRHENGVGRCGIRNRRTVMTYRDRPGSELRVTPGIKDVSDTHDGIDQGARSIRSGDCVVFQCDGPAAGDRYTPSLPLPSPRARISPAFTKMCRRPAPFRKKARRSVA